jgi:HipA-like protein
MLRSVNAIRYVTPLREGGSLPAIVEADDEGTYVLKFRGAGQGKQALIAELIVGELGRVLDLPVPELVLVELDRALGPAEPDYEIQSLLKASVGLNLGMDFLPGSVGFDPAAKTLPAPGLASDVVWFDAFVMNVDRTARNPNMLIWHKRLWLIDHGASLYFQHNWTDPLQGARSPFQVTKTHVLLPLASSIRESDAKLRERLTRSTLEAIVAEVPDSWLGGAPGANTVAEERSAYVNWLEERLKSSELFVEEALRARAQLV